MVGLPHVDSIGLRKNGKDKGRVCRLFGGNIKVSYMKNLEKEKEGGVGYLSFVKVIEKGSA